MYTRPPLDAAPTIQQLLFAESYETFIMPPAMDIRFSTVKPCLIARPSKTFTVILVSPQRFSPKSLTMIFNRDRNQYLDVKTCVDLCEEGEVPHQMMPFVMCVKSRWDRHGMSLVGLICRCSSHMKPDFILSHFLVLPGKIAPLDIALSQAQASLQVGETERVREPLEKSVSLWC